MANCGCNDYSRTQLLRRAAAEAGQGLPAIEPGMPLPAGTGLTRRSFVSRATGLALSVYGAASLGPKAFEHGIASAAAQAPANDPIFVSIFLSGGADALTLLAPTTAHPQYAQWRPTLALPAGQGTPLAEDPTLRFHPSLDGIAELYGEGKVTVMPAIGYDDANQSHFTSRHYWEVGEVNPWGRWGWLGRYLDHHGVADNPLQGLTLGWDLQPSLAAHDVPVATVGQPDNYDFWTPGVWGDVQDKMLDAFGDLGDPPTSDAGLAQARGAVAATGRLRDQLAPYQGGFTTPAGVTYPNGDLAGQLRALAAMIAGGLPLKVVGIESGGYDTHSNQLESLPGDLLQIGNTLRAFQRDLEARGIQDRVLVHVWSEFGRRPEENGSGTDHGAAGTGFLIGSKAKGEMVGEFPGLAVLDEDDNLRNTSDFRGVYCALLEQWLGVDAGPIIPNASNFTRPVLVG